MSKQKLSYAVVSISLYWDDVELLGRLAQISKVRGDKRASKSDVVRRALKLLAGVEVEGQVPA